MNPEPCSLVQAGYSRSLAYASVESGWHELIRAIFVALERENLLRAQAGQIGARIIQVKPKMGSLRVYLEDAPAALVELVRESEARSVRTCEVCGARGSTRVDLGYWTLCDRHTAERRAERLHLRLRVPR